MNEITRRRVSRREFELLVKTNTIQEFIITKKENQYELSATHKYESIEIILESSRSKIRTWKRLNTLIDYIESIEFNHLPIRIER